MDKQDLSPGGRIAIGFALAAVGLGCVGIYAYGQFNEYGARPDDNFFLPAFGLLFFFAGASMALPAGHPRLSALIGALMFTSLALMLDWIAFGPGERNFGVRASLGALGSGGHAPEWFGRTAFGLVALLLDGIAFACWWLLWRRHKALQEADDSAANR